MAILDNQDFLKQVQERYSSLESRREALRQSGSNRKIEGPNTFREALGRAVRSEFGTPHYGVGGQPLNEAARMLEQLDSGRRSGPPEIFSGGPAFMAGTDRREGESQSDRFQRLADQFNERFYRLADQFNARFDSEQAGGVPDVIDATEAVAEEPEEPSQPTFSFPMMDPMGQVAVEEDDGFTTPAFVSPRACLFGKFFPSARSFWDFF